MSTLKKFKIAVVIPCFRVREQIMDVLTAIGPEVWRIYVVDDACPEGTGSFVRDACNDPRVNVLDNASNQGVGGAVIRGYYAGLEDGADVLVKLDGDGQMDPALIPRLVAPIADGYADYAKGNRFFDLSNIDVMPRVRLFGNAVLSFFAKFSTGYWNIFDPNNGFTAIHAGVLRHLPLKLLAKRYFFESDMLFRLNILRAVVVDIPMDAKYGNEKSNLVIRKIWWDFLRRHTVNTLKRIFYNYFLRDMSVASLELLAGILLFGFGIIFGASHWLNSLKTSVPASSGTVMLAALPVILGLQFLLAFLVHDVASVPQRPVHPLLATYGLHDRREIPFR